jgi:hypothetical protein
MQTIVQRIFAFVSTHEYPSQDFDIKSMGDRFQ